MFRNLKTSVFILEGINAYATAYYFNYLFFLLRDRFGFGSRGNLAMSALHGFIYFFAAVRAGKFAERRGFLTSLRVGFSGMALAMAAAGIFYSLAGQFVALALWTVAMMFTWPALEAMASTGENRAGLQRMVGIYNCVWAGCSALAYFTGGALFERLGVRSIFWLPAGLHVLQFIIVLRLGNKSARAVEKALGEIPPAHKPEAVAFKQSISPKTFLKLGWLANPFAYVAMNTVLAVIPALARRFHLSVTESGLFFSIWFLVRLAAFFALWHWPGWHYRFRWLAGAFALLIAGFATLLLAPELWILVLAQISFGAAVGLIYYSSLFYSMDVGETKGEHGGWHEAFIGAGICVGPGIGAAALQFAPGLPNAGTWAVSTLLICGLAGLIRLRRENDSKT